jgi:hypothetical protein
MERNESKADGLEYWPADDAARGPFQAKSKRKKKIITHAGSGKQKRRN